MMVIFGNSGRQLSFLFGGVSNFMSIANPTTGWFIRKIGAQVFVSVGHILLLYHTFA